MHPDMHTFQFFVIFSKFSSINPEYRPQHQASIALHHVSKLGRQGVWSRSNLSESTVNNSGGRFHRTLGFSVQLVSVPTMGTMYVGEVLTCGLSIFSPVCP